MVLYNRFDSGLYTRYTLCVLIDSVFLFSILIVQFPTPNEFIDFLYAFLPQFLIKSQHSPVTLHDFISTSSECVSFELKYIFDRSIEIVNNRCLVETYGELRPMSGVSLFNN